ncbi:hypothetical protein JXJ21_02560 [candidate division KSB1 bacterium]|nr:hypothetical protein [candidate division KSB1 bacterium]
MKLDDHITRVIERSRAFFNAPEPGHFLISTHIPVDSPAIPPLNQFDLDTQLTEWLEYLLEAERPKWRIKEGLDDDSIPCICPSFGIAEHTAWLGMDVQFQETTCLPVPGLKFPADLDALVLSDETRWFNYMKRGYEYLRERKDGTFVLSVRGTMMPMDIANAIRGDEIFLDFMLDPQFVHRLMQFLVDAIRWYYDQLRTWADELEYGHAFRLGNGWIGPNCLGHTSNDLAMMCSAEIYREFGFPYEQQLAQHYNRVLYHVHNEKIHYVPDVATLSNLALLEVSHDPKTVPPIEDLDNIFNMTGNANLMLHATSDQVRAQLNKLAARNVFLNIHCRDRADAEDVVALVRKHSKPL